jgi:pyruvate dehydrogenase E2 component (dihydrolipoamide acetyltransferase)
VIASDFQSGAIANWHKAVGDSVAKGEVLFDIETDKAVVDVEADESGVLGAICVPGGSKAVPVNTIVGYLLRQGETLADIPDAGAVSLQVPAARESQFIPPLQVPERIFASPLARRIAAQRDVELSAIRGSGPNGRILKADVEAAVGQAAIQVGSEAKQPSIPKRLVGLDIPNSRMRKAIASRLTAAKRDIPHFYLTIDCELDALLDVRHQLNEHFETSGIKVSVNDCVVKAAALALADVRFTSMEVSIFQ